MTTPQANTTPKPARSPRAAKRGKARAKRRVGAKAATTHPKAPASMPNISVVEAAQLEEQRRGGSYKFRPEHKVAPLPGPQAPPPAAILENEIVEAPPHLIRMVHADAGASVGGFALDETGATLVPVGMVDELKGHGFRVQHLRELVLELGESGAFSYFGEGG